LPWTCQLHLVYLCPFLCLRGKRIFFHISLVSLWLEVNQYPSKQFKQFTRFHKLCGKPRRLLISQYVDMHKFYTNEFQNVSWTVFATSVNPAMSILLPI
jgi:hypothetical protein